MVKAKQDDDDVKTTLSEEPNDMEHAHQTTDGSDTHREDGKLQECGEPQPRHGIGIYYRKNAAVIFQQHQKISQ